MQFIELRSPASANLTTKSPDLALSAAKVISADAFARNFVATQSLGGMLAVFPFHVLEASPFEGFSHYSKEACHEYLHGNGTCSKRMHRDGKCICESENTWQGALID